MFAAKIMKICSDKIFVLIIKKSKLPYGSFFNAVKLLFLRLQLYHYHIKQFPLLSVCLWEQKVHCRSNPTIFLLFLKAILVHLFSDAQELIKGYFYCIIIKLNSSARLCNHIIPCFCLQLYRTIYVWNGNKVNIVCNNIFSKKGIYISECNGVFNNIFAANIIFFFIIKIVLALSLNT